MDSITVASPTKMRVSIPALEWGSKRGGLSTFIREFAIQLAKLSNVQVFVIVPQCDQEEKDAALKKNVALIQATRGLEFYDETELPCFPPKELQIDCVIGHGVLLGVQAKIIREARNCKWVQFVHTDSEDLGMFKDYPGPMSKAEKKDREVDLYEMADLVVLVGPKLADAYRCYLRYNTKDQNLLVFTPGIFSEFDNAMQSKEKGDKFQVLVLIRGDVEDCSLKGVDIAVKAAGLLKDEVNLIFLVPPGTKQDDVASLLKEYNGTPEYLRVRNIEDCFESFKQVLSEVDLAIMPSRTKEFGVAALEAISANLPVLITDNTGLGQVLKKVPFGSQYVVSSDDVEEWAKKIQTIRHKDNQLRTEDAEILRNNYGKIYSWDEQCSVLVDKITNMPNDNQAKGPGLQDDSEHEMESTCPVLKPDDEMAAEDTVTGEYWSCEECKETLTKFDNRWQCSNEHMTCDNCVSDQLWDTGSLTCLDEDCTDLIHLLPSFNTEKEVLYVFVDFSSSEEVMSKDIGHLIDTVVSDREFAMVTLYGYKPGSSDTVWDKISKHGSTLVLKMSSGTCLVSDIVSVVSRRGVKKGTVVIVNVDPYMIPAVAVGLKKSWLFEVWMSKSCDPVAMRKLAQESADQLKIYNLDAL